MTAIDSVSLRYDGSTFQKVTDETDNASLQALTEMAVGLEAFIGEWENDTNYMQLVITQDSYTLDETDAQSQGSFIKGPDYLLIGMDELRLTTTGDGGLKLEGYDGTFWPADGGKGAQSPFAPFAGVWYNKTIDQYVEITADGEYSIILEDGFSAGGCSVENGVLTFSDYTATLVDGKLVVDGIEGDFTKSGE